jgi:hypothetical protein
MLKAISRASFRRSSTTTATLRAYRKAASFPITVGNRAYHRMFRIAGRKGIYLRPGLRAVFFVSIASAAENFRSTCASERGAPECSKQHSPGATPHVGQRTASNCFAERLLFLICIQCDKTSRKTIPYRTLFAPGIRDCRSYRTSDFSCPVRDLPVLTRRGLCKQVSPCVRQNVRRGSRAGKQLIPPDGV